MKEYNRPLEERNKEILDIIIDTDFNNHKNFKDYRGMTLGHLYVNSYAGFGSDGKNYFWCECLACGNMVIKSSKYLRKSENKGFSCGCIEKESQSKNGQRLVNSNHKHDETNTRLHRIWAGMRQRCNNPNNTSYHNYGGRGIKICPEWDNKKTGYLVFRDWALANGYNDELTIDRIDSDDDYCPENCRWITIQDQENNKRTIHYVHIDRWVLPLKCWAKIVGINYTTLCGRVGDYGWDPVDAVLTPIDKLPPERIPILDIPFEYEKYNKYDEWVKKGKIKPVEETIYKDCPYIEHK